MVKRTRLDIITDMLIAVQNKRGRIKPTHIMYRANLSHAQLTQYLDELIEKELVQQIKTQNNKTYFTITNKGCKFLEKVGEMRQFEKSFGF